jgi:repressor LexA
MTAGQKRVFEFICDYVRETQRAPTYRDIQTACGYASPNAAQTHVKALRAAGLIQPIRNTARSILPVRNPDSIPVFGTIPAGIPIDAVEQKGDVVEVSETVFGMKMGTKLFALRVRGQSMKDAGINDGDLVVLVNRPVRNGDIVAALVDGQSTLKRYLTRQGKAVLKPENRAMKSIRPAEDLTIQGVMIGLIRVGSS